MPKAPLTALHHQILELRTHYRNVPQMVPIEDVVQLEQLTRAVKLLRDDMIIAEINAGIDQVSIGLKHALTPGRVSQIHSQSTRLPKGDRIRPIKTTPKPYGHYQRSQGPIRR